jgi:P-type E1-E2 ATPase
LDKKKVKSIEVNSQELLPGDILILHEGDIVPCDCIILKGEILVD